MNEGNLDLDELASITIDWLFLYFDKHKIIHTEDMVIMLKQFEEHPFKRICAVRLVEASELLQDSEKSSKKG